MLFLLLALSAHADDRTSWEALQDELLEESLGGDLKRAQRRYQGLVRNLADDDPTRGRALYWLGRTRRSMGDVSGAREALRECVRAGEVRRPCLDLLGDMEIERTAIRDVPTRWTFEDDDHGFVHPWAYADKGVIRLRRSEVLSWVTNVDARRPDRLLVGFRDPSPQPRGARFRAQAVSTPAHLRLMLYDIDGHGYSLPLPVAVPVGTFIDVQVDFRNLVALEGAPVRFVATRADLMVIEDVTGDYGGSGENELLIDDFVVY
jgi:hypothetical protein